jgi:hypothetical protein
MKTTIDLPDPLFRRAKATAAVEGVTLKHFITEAVAKKLDGGAKKSWREVLADLPRLPKETLETIRLRVEESDRDSLDYPNRAARNRP